MTIERNNDIHIGALRRITSLAAIALLCAMVGASMFGSSVALADHARVGANGAARARPGHAAEATPAKPTRKSLAGKLNLNTATASELELLPGVGPTKADRVVAWRSKNGSFKRVVDLRRVKGFGRKSVDKLEPYLTVKEKTSLHLE
jgi:comEA protein